MESILVTSPLNILVLSWELGGVNSICRQIQIEDKNKIHWEERLQILCTFVCCLGRWVGWAASLLAPEVAAVAVIGQNPARPGGPLLPIVGDQWRALPIVPHCSTNPPPTSRGERHTLAAEHSRPRPHSKKLRQ